MVTTTPPQTAGISHAPEHPHRRKNVITAAAPRLRGFSLCEVLVGLAVISLLTTLGVGGLSHISQQSRRAQAAFALQDIQEAQERYHLQRGRYADHINQLQAAGELPEGALPAGLHYHYRIEKAGPWGYQLGAQAQGQQAADTNCQYLGVQKLGLSVIRHAGPAAEGSKREANRRHCWRLHP